MDARKTSLQIKANLKNKEDKAFDKKDLQLEYFDLKNNKWTKLLDGLNAIDGKLDAILKIGTLEKTNRTAFAMFNQVMKGNTVPSIRLIDGTTADDEWTVVFSMFPIVHVSEKMLVVDFGDLWLLDYPINRHIKGTHPNVEFTIGAFPRPNGNHALFSPLQFALLNSDVLEDYSPEEFEVKIVARGEEDRLMKKNEELELILKEKEHELEAQLRRNEELSARIEELTRGDYEDDGGTKDDTKDEVKDESPGKLDGKIAEARPARDVYTTIVDEVKSASEKLEETPYTLANISLNLKTHVVTDEDGFKLQLIDAETAKNAGEGTISEVKIDIGTKGNQTKADNKLSTPNIIGLTETAARQRLKSFGLKMKVIYQTSKTKTIGHSFKQKPAPGDDINKGDTVITIFAKNSEKFN